MSGTSLALPIIVLLLVLDKKVFAVFSLSFGFLLISALLRKSAEITVCDLSY
jgi:hypothetical protein